MHEQSLVRSLLRQVEAICRQQRASRVIEVHVEVGPLSGVEPLLLESAFEQLKGNSVAAHATLVIECVPLSVRCKGCGNEFQVEDYVFLCGRCGGGVEVVRGEDLLLVSVSVEDAAGRVDERAHGVAE